MIHDYYVTKVTHYIVDYEYKPATEQVVIHSVTRDGWNVTQGMGEGSLKNIRDEILSISGQEELPEDDELFTLKNGNWSN